jgi:3-oxoadipate enol-lactonase
MHTSGQVNLHQTLQQASTMPVEEWAHEIGRALFGGAYIAQHHARILALARWRKRHPAPPEGVARQWQAFASFDASDRLSAIRCPVLVAHGSDDRLSPMQNARWLVQEIPNSQLKVLELLGHSPNIEAPEVYNRVIEDFLTR